MADLDWTGARNLTIGHVKKLLDEIAGTIRSIDRSLLDAHEPEAGAYAFFNHSSHLLTRTEDIGLVTRRLLARREELSEAYRAEGDLMTAGVKPYGPEHQRVLTQAADLSRDMRLDMESLYLFGALAVDQFAHLALRLGGLPQKAPNTGTGNAFTLFAKWLENGRYGALQPLWQTVGHQLVWVRWHVWFYRNQLIVHADRPWQRGSNHGHTIDDFSLFIPAPLGWNDHSALFPHVAEVWREVQEVLDDDREPSTTPPGVLLDTMFLRIDEVPRRATRRAIGDLYAQMGGMTPSFQIIAGRTLLFLRNGTAVLGTIAAERAAEVDLGNPHVTQAELMRRYRVEEEEAQP